MPIVFTNLTGDWRRIVEDYVTDPENAADTPGVEGTITVTPVLGEGRHAPRGVPSGGVFYTFEALDLRVYRGLLRDQNMNADITVAIEVDGYPVAWRARFDLQYRRIRIPLHDVFFGPDEIVDGQISLSSLVARDGVPPEYEGSYVQLMDAVAQAAAARDAAEGHADRAETVAAGVESAAQIVTDNVDAINDLPSNIAAVNAARDGAEDARDQSEGHASAAAGSASAASDSAGAASSSAEDAQGYASDAAGSASAAAGSATDADASRSAAVSARGGAESARDDAAGSATAAGQSASDAAGAAQDALGHAQGAESWATSFDVSATADTGAPGTDAAVTVSGDGPAYALGFTIPRGDKGDTGPAGEVSQAQLDAAVASLVDGAPEALDTLSELAAALGHDPNFATTVSEAIGRRARIDGAPEEYDSLGKLVSALLAGELGGSTDASVLTGALTDQVDASEAMVTYPYSEDPEADPIMLTNTLAIAIEQAVGWMPNMMHLFGAIDDLDGAKADVDHSHTAADVGAVANAGGVTGIRRVTQAEYDGLTPDPNVLYIVEG